MALLTWSSLLRPALLLAALIVPLGTAPQTRTTAAAAHPACNVVNSLKDVPAAGTSSVTTVQQAYQCLLSHYVTGTTSLDDRTLLRGAYSTIVSNLPQQTAAVAKSIPMPLTGDRDKDWRAFSQWYTGFLKQLRAPDSIAGPLADAALYGMAGSLNDAHTGYLPAQYLRQVVAQLGDGPVPTIGLVLSPTSGNTLKDPIFITDVFTGTPAAAAGLQPGDIITAIDGSALVIDGQPGAGLASLLIPSADAVLALTVKRPSTGTVRLVSLTVRTLATPVVTSRVLASGALYIRLYNFTSDASNRLFKAIADAAKKAPLSGVVLDLRNNPGGDKDQAVRIISAFIHKSVLAYTVDGKGHRVAQRTDNTVPLLKLPLAVLIDDGSASSSELVASAVKDLKLGQIVGRRSAGEIAEAEFFGLNDGGGMEITELRVLGPKAEKLEGVGVTPDVSVSSAPLDLASGHDPVIARADKMLSRVAVQ